MEADEVIRDDDAGITTALGNIEVRYNNRTLRADRLRSSGPSVRVSSDRIVTRAWRPRVIRKANWPTGESERPASMTTAMIAPIDMLPALNR